MRLEDKLDKQFMGQMVDMKMWFLLGIWQNRQRYRNTDPSQQPFSEFPPSHDDSVQVTRVHMPRRGMEPPTHHQANI